MIGVQPRAAMSSASAPSAMMTTAVSREGRFRGALKKCAGVGAVRIRSRSFRACLRQVGQASSTPCMKLVVLVRNFVFPASEAPARVDSDGRGAGIRWSSTSSRPRKRSGIAVLDAPGDATRTTSLSRRRSSRSFRIAATAPQIPKRGRRRACEGELAHLGHQQREVTARRPGRERVSSSRKTVTR